MGKNITIGMDLGDQNHVVVALDKDGDEVEMKTIRNTELSLRKISAGIKRLQLPLKLAPISAVLQKHAVAGFQNAVRLVFQNELQPIYQKN